MELLVFYLTDSRRHFTFPHFIEMINTSERKNKFKLFIKYDFNYEFLNRSIYELYKKNTQGEG